MIRLKSASSHSRIWLVIHPTPGLFPATLPAGDTSQPTSACDVRVRTSVGRFPKGLSLHCRSGWVTDRTLICSLVSYFVFGVILFCWSVLLRSLPLSTGAFGLLSRCAMVDYTGAHGKMAKDHFRPSAGRSQRLWYTKASILQAILPMRNPESCTQPPTTSPGKLHKCVRIWDG